MIGGSDKGACLLQAARSLILAVSDKLFQEFLNAGVNSIHDTTDSPVPVKVHVILGRLEDMSAKEFLNSAGGGWMCVPGERLLSYGCFKKEKGVQRPKHDMCRSPGPNIRIV